MKKVLSILALVSILLAEEAKYHVMQLGDMLLTRIEIVDTDEGRTRGLMHRKELPCDGGMLFLFDKAEPRTFWMRNTLIPLDIVFMDEKGTVLAIHTMKVEAPQGSNESDDAYCARLPLYSSIKPAKAALEVNAGMASNVKVGDTIKLPQ